MRCQTTGQYVLKVIEMCLLLLTVPDEISGKLSNLVLSETGVVTENVVCFCPQGRMKQEITDFFPAWLVPLQQVYLHSHWSHSNNCFPQGQLRYEITGYYPAQSFFAVNPTTGVVNISQDLRLDSLKLGVYRVCESGELGGGGGGCYFHIVRNTYLLSRASSDWTSTEVPSPKLLFAQFSFCSLVKCLQAGDFFLKLYETAGFKKKEGFLVGCGLPSLYFNTWENSG